MNHLHQLDKDYVWHPFTPLVGGDDPLLITSAHGIYLHTHEGRQIIDAISSWWVNLHGHSHPHIAEAISDQAKKLEHVIFAGFTHEPAIQVASNLISILPGNQKKIFFSDNGSTAVEVALKLAFQFWHNQGIKRNKVIAINGAYHGDTFGSMSVGDRGMFTSPFFSYLFDVEFIEFPSVENEDEVFKKFSTIVEKNDVASFIFEPLVQAAAGMRMYSNTFLDKLIKQAQDNKVLCIADEVFTGFGRTGKMFASDYLINKPDIIALSKGITGGTMPLGATSCSEKITEAFRTNDFSKTFFHGHSFTANPLACAAANASFELLMQNSCLENRKMIEASHLDFIERISENAYIKNARALGTILALELKHTEETSYKNPLRRKIYAYFLERNILLRPLGNVIYILPPYVITQQELNIIYNAIEDFLNEM